MEKIKSSVTEALLDFDSLPGVSAVFVSDAEGGVVAARNGTLEPERVQTVAGHIAKAFEKTRNENMGSDSITFSYANGLVVARSFHDSGNLSVLCAPDVNFSSLNLLMDLVISKVGKELEKRSQSSGGSDPVSIESLFEGSMGDSLRQIATELCDHIGPAGDIVLSDSIKKWSEGSSPTESGLSGLISIVEDELGADGSEDWLLKLKKKIISP